MIINKQLKTIPFDKLYEVYEEAAQAAVEGLEQHYEEIRMQKLERMEQAYTDSHEAPSEVGFGDLVDVQQFDASEIRRRAGQKAATDVWIPRYKLSSLLVSVLPQALAHIANKPFVMAEVVTAEGKIDSTKIIKHAFDFRDPWERGLYIFLMLDSRSAYLASQYKGEGVQFCALVPLILYAYKLHHKIPYSKWDVKSLHWTVNKSLLDAMKHEGTYSREDLLAARELGLVYQNGVKKGESRNPQSNFKLWATKGGCLHGVPHLAQVMLTQIWCAHPSNRTPYMVLDPKSWDIMPTPLIAQDIFKQVVSAVPPGYTGNPYDLPWLV
jgi:hypothetical protein